MAEGFTPDAGGGFTQDPGADTSVGAGAATGIGAGVGAIFGKGGSLSKDALEKVKSDAGEMKAAASGGFGVSEEMGDAYIKAYNGLLSDIAKMRRDIERAAIEVPLGGDEYAKLISQHNAKVARGDGQSFEAALEALEVIAEQAIDAFKAAKKTYQQMEEAGQKTFSTKDLVE